MSTPSKPNPIPNLLTALRLLAGVIMFLMLAGAMGGVPLLSAYLSPEDQFALQRTAFIIFVIAASTDWVDGFLARRWHAESRWGAILDPIADQLLALIWTGAEDNWMPTFVTFADILVWVAALVTLWTGWQYFAKAREQMR